MSDAHHDQEPGLLQKLKDTYVGKIIEIKTLTRQGIGTKAISREIDETKQEILGLDSETDFTTLDELAKARFLQQIEDQKT